MFLKASLSNSFGTFFQVLWMDANLQISCCTGAWLLMAITHFIFTSVWAQMRYTHSALCALSDKMLIEGLLLPTLAPKTSDSSLFSFTSPPPGSVSSRQSSAYHSEQSASSGCSIPAYSASAVASVATRSLIPSGGVDDARRMQNLERNSFVATLEKRRRGNQLATAAYHHG